MMKNPKHKKKIQKAIKKLETIRNKDLAGVEFKYLEERITIDQLLSKAIQVLVNATR